ncbi:MAG: FAD:protein FMN transferase [Candidatus Omnitrophica bacterium]|jgi:thiamine biosynthesis lipoprotein|nr:FAD:protein FMN transferase [Candidatus Omnitrophota bacterium]
MFKNYFIAGVILAVFLMTGCGRPMHRDKQVLMGSFVEVVSADPRAAGIVFAEIRRIEDIFTKFDEDSELSRLNRNGEAQVSPELFYLLKRAKDFWLASNGAFDVTVAPLADLWGFTKRDYRIPADDRIKQTLEAVGSNKIVFLETNNVVKFTVSGMKIDLGAIVPGYAVDCAVSKLKEAGISSCLINCGGEVYGLGDRAGRKWSVGIRSAFGKNIGKKLELKDRAVATSGDYEQYFNKGKRHYSHLIDPRTGYPADSRISSVTVAAPDCLTADALSTSVFIMGKEKGEEMAGRFPGVEIVVIQKTNGQE